MPTVRATVFGGGQGSYWERELFYRLKKSFGDRINLWHNLPVLNVFDLKPSEVTSGEYEYLLKSSIAFTACDPASDRPLASLEFDGWGKGYSDGFDRYVPHHTTDDLRALKMRLKLRLAGEVNYPFTVVSADERERLVGTDGLTIAHGVLGTMLASVEEEKRWPEWLESFRNFPPNDPIWDDQMKELQARFLARMEAETEWNPLAAARERAYSAVMATGKVMSIDVVEAWEGESAFARVRVVLLDGSVRDFPHRIRGVGPASQWICEHLAVMLAAQRLTFELNSSAGL